MAVEILKLTNIVNDIGLLPLTILLRSHCAVQILSKFLFEHKVLCILTEKIGIFSIKIILSGLVKVDHFRGLVVHWWIIAPISSVIDVLATTAFTAWALTVFVSVSLIIAVFITIRFLTDFISYLLKILKVVIGRLGTVIIEEVVLPKVDLRSLRLMILWILLHHLLFLIIHLECIHFIEFHLTWKVHWCLQSLMGRK